MAYDRLRKAGSGGIGATLNPVLKTIRMARQLNWCTTPCCTTCGAREYRQALAAFSGPLGGGLVNALAAIEPQNLAGIPGWQDPLLVAVMDLPFCPQVEDVLEAWLPHIPSDIRFADWALYRIVRWLPVESLVREKWIDGCRALALATRDSSLVESLILVLHSAALSDQELVSVALEHAASSAQMRRVLKNACGMDVPAQDEPQARRPTRRHRGRYVERQELAVTGPGSDEVLRTRK